MLLNVWEQRGDSEKRRLAFILATARRESQSTFTAIREAPRCRDDEACRERVIGALLAKRAERNKKPPRPNYALPDSSGHRYYGRGFIQLTFKKNYAAAGDKLGIDLVNNPEPRAKGGPPASPLLRPGLSLGTDQSGGLCHPCPQGLESGNRQIVLVCLLSKPRHSIQPRC